MDDYNVNVLSEAKNEYSSRLVSMLHTASVICGSSDSQTDSLVEVARERVAAMRLQHKLSDSRSRHQEDREFTHINGGRRLFKEVLPCGKHLFSLGKIRTVSNTKWRSLAKF